MVAGPLMPHVSPKIMYALSAIMLISISWQTAEAGDWPRWMGANMDGVWDEPDTIDRFPEDGLAIAWRRSIGGGYAGPSVVADRV